MLQLKAVVVNDELQILHETQVQFDNDLPEFRYFEVLLIQKNSFCRL